MRCKDMEMKTLRRILVLIWCMLAIFNLVITIHNPSPLGWFFTGVMFGGVFIMLLDHGIMNSQEKFIKWLVDVNELYSKRLTNYLSEKYLSKKVKGGKNKKK